MSETGSTPSEVITFWRGAGPDRWYEKDAAFDEEIRRRFLKAYEAAAAGKLTAWESSAEGALALLILIDQLPRNMFRGHARSYAADPLARAVASRAILNGFDGAIPDLRDFFYLPFSHSENLADQERAVAIHRAHNDANGLKWAELHADIIRRFGRFPHRNAVLGRLSTPEEQAFLDGGGFKG
jgi:uncharacterized protein (DUF924 family)